MQTFTPIEYLKIDVASSYGLDKKSWNERLDWFHANEIDLVQIPDLGPAAQEHPLVQDADSPALFIAGLGAYLKAIRGESISYPISLDATASGAQLLAVLIGCEKSARACNVVDTGRREDLYTNAYHGMLKRMDLDSTDAVITRSDAKQAVMTSLYGSKAQPKKVFGEGDQLEIFFQTMQDDFTGIWELNQGLLELWDSTALSHDWTLPDNFHVKTKTMDDRKEHVQFLNRNVEVNTKVNRPTETGRSLGANTIHSLDGMVVREMSRRCSYDAAAIGGLMHILHTGASRTRTRLRPEDELVLTLWQHYERTGFLSARILELLDEENIEIVDRDVILAMIKTLPENPFPILAVHDCFRCHPNYGNDLRRTYNQILHEIAKSDLLADLAYQIGKHEIPVVKYDDIADQILTANYALS